MEVAIDYIEHDRNFMNTLAACFQREDYIDVVFVCKNGRKVMANKQIMSCVSPFLKMLFTEWEGKEDKITLMLPEVDCNTLNLVLDFMFEGSTNLSRKEFMEFKNLIKMLDMRFPGSSVKERELSPVDPPPPIGPVSGKKANQVNPTAERSSVQNVGGDASNQTGGDTNTQADINTNNQESENRARVPVTPRKANDPLDDPLNVPDYYYAAPAGRQNTAGGSKPTPDSGRSSHSGRHSGGQSGNQSGSHSSNLTSSSSAGKDGKSPRKNPRKRPLQPKLEDTGSSGKPPKKKSSRKQNPREDGKSASSEQGGDRAKTRYH